MPRNPLQVGDVIHGFAHGLFGRDHYTCVEVEAVGRDWAVLRGVSSHRRRYVVMLSGDDELKRGVEEVASPDFYHCKNAEYAGYDSCSSDDDD